MDVCRIQRKTSGGCYRTLAWSTPGPHDIVRGSRLVIQMGVLSLTPSTRSSALLEVVDCAKRSFQSVVHENLVFVRRPPFVRKIIDFCEEDMEDGRVLLSTGTLNS